MGLSLDVTFNKKNTKDLTFFGGFCGGPFISEQLSILMFEVQSELQDVQQIQAISATAGVDVLGPSRNDFK